ncbi:MAG: hypothetical protein A2Y23_10090 [Clostridiales bacterium GWB2_37_7]|nr:MAG: hypothetical protein A2Y23_10090 [Clostridiales bacterium GWB2_37_7]
MWFDEIMDDCKQALITANKYKSVFVPIFLKLALSIAIFAFIFITFIAGIFRNEYILDYSFADYYTFMEILPTIITYGILIYLMVLVSFSILDVGSINMFKSALNEQKPKFKDFTEGIKKYLFKVILGKLFIHLLIIITLPLTALLYLLYALVAGTLTAGWGMLFLSVFISVYLGTWVIILVVEGYSPFKAIRKSIKLGRKYFKSLFIILLASTLVSSFSTVVFGVLAAVLAGWFIAGVVATYFKLVVMLVYYRNKEDL